jgi:hypothetical protein
VVSDLSDLDETGCEINGKTRPVVPVTLPRPEKVKRKLFFNVPEMFLNCNIDIVCVKCRFVYTYLLDSHFLMFNF